MMLFNRLHNETKAVLTRTYRVAQQYRHHQVTSEHLLLALLDEEIVAKSLQLLSVDVDAIRTRLNTLLVTEAPEQVQIRGASGSPTQVFIAPGVKRVLDLSFEEAELLGDNSILPEHLFLALLREHDTAARLLAEYDLAPDRVRPIINSLRSETG
jgi:ATP-dependent Clp protease ATP-binding subunit ClpA